MCRAELGWAGDAAPLTHEGHPDGLAAGELCKGPPRPGAIASAGHQPAEQVSSGERKVVAGLDVTGGGAAAGGTGAAVGAHGFLVHDCWGARCGVQSSESEQQEHQAEGARRGSQRRKPSARCGLQRGVVRRGCWWGSSSTSSWSCVHSTGQGLAGQTGSAGAERPEDGHLGLPCWTGRPCRVVNVAYNISSSDNGESDCSKGTGQEWRGPSLNSAGCALSGGRRQCQWWLAGVGEFCALIYSSSSHLRAPVFLRAAQVFGAQFCCTKLVLHTQRPIACESIKNVSIK